MDAALQWTLTGEKPTTGHRLLAAEATIVRRTRQRLLGSLRGAGELRAAGRTYSISYELDRFEDGGGQRASGAISGDVHELLALGENSVATLVMEDGAEIAVLVSNAGPDGADVEATGSALEQ